MAAFNGNFTVGDVRARKTRSHGKFGALNTYSRERARAELFGIEADPKKIGSPGDLIVGDANYARYRTELAGPSGCRETETTSISTTPAAEG
jgi:hypothetical protein